MLKHFGFFSALITMLILMPLLVVGHTEEKDAVNIYHKPTSLIKHEGLTPGYVLPSDQIPPSCVKSEFTQTSHIHSNHINEEKNIRPIVFEDDLLQFVDVNPTYKKFEEQFKQLDIIIKAVNEYKSHRGQMIEVKIKNNKWVIVIKNLTEELLLECVPLPDMLLESFTSNNILEKYLKKATSYLTKFGIYIWTKTFAKYAKCTVYIHGNIKPDEEYVLCSDVIIDLLDLADENRLIIKRSAKNLLNTEIVISEKE